MDAGGRGKPLSVSPSLYDYTEYISNDILESSPNRGILSIDTLDSWQEPLGAMVVVPPDVASHDSEIPTSVNVDGKSNLNCIQELQGSGNLSILEEDDDLEQDSVFTAAWVRIEAEIDCNCCVLLREVVHSNGLQSTKLAIHGGINTFYHAIVEVHSNIDAYPLADSRFYADLSTASYKSVKQFLIEYGLRRMCDNFCVMEDTVSAFIDVLCTDGSFSILCTNMTYDAASSNAIQESSPDLGEFSELCQSGTICIPGYEIHHVPVSEDAAMLNHDNVLLSLPGNVTTDNPDYSAIATTDNVATRTRSNATPRISDHNSYGVSSNKAKKIADNTPKSKMSIQRERTGNMTLRDLAGYFEIPIADAAQKIGLCATALKKICRRERVPRWPFRKIQSIDKQIEKHERELRTARGLEATKALAAIEELKIQKAHICCGNPPK